jgi:hypothetical protein
MHLRPRGVPYGAECHTLEALPEPLGSGCFSLICHYKFRVISPTPPSPQAPCPPTRRAANPALFHSSSFPKSLLSTSSKSTTSALFRKTPGGVPTTIEPKSALPPAPHCPRSFHHRQPRQQSQQIQHDTDTPGLGSVLTSLLPPCPCSLPRSVSQCLCVTNSRVFRFYPYFVISLLLYFPSDPLQ